ncbi:MAG: hypothetical protein LBN38_01250 [Verrucomicrobiota bacterium]|jgi:hypothetical protein|nr:hypothetical protein [Verrucomicrobiota bacterium]
MNTRRRSGIALLLMVALVWAWMPATPVAASDNTTTGAAVTIGLVGAVVVVYALISLRSDVERYSQADLDATMERAAKAAEESPLVLQAITAHQEWSAPSTGLQEEVAGAAIGWRLVF